MIIFCGISTFVSFPFGHLKGILVYYLLSSCVVKNGVCMAVILKEDVMLFSLTLQFPIHGQLYLVFFSLLWPPQKLQGYNQSNYWRLKCGVVELELSQTNPVSMHASRPASLESHYRPSSMSRHRRRPPYAHIRKIFYLSLSPKTAKQLICEFDYIHILDVDSNWTPRFPSCAASHAYHFYGVQART